jgi:kynurenine formamidase
MTDLIDRIDSASIYDLSQPFEVGMPAPATHPGFKMAMLSRHGDTVRDAGLSAAVEMLVLGGHSGTHIDALGHVSIDGKLHGGVDARQAQVGGRLSHGGIETVAPILCKGVLLDIAGHRGIDSLPAGEPITADELQSVADGQGVHLPRGGAVLIRSGWSRHWNDPEYYLGNPGGTPGPDSSAAEWIASARPLVTGHDSMAYEWLAPGMGHSRLPVHGIMLVNHGIHLLENLNLEGLARDRIFEFIFVCLPLRVTGGTGSPVRPVAVVL